MANYVFYSLMCIYGFIYVNVSNMNGTRKSVLHSSYANYFDFTLVIICIPFTYFLSTTNSLKAPTDRLLADNNDVALELFSKEECYTNNIRFWLIGFICGLQYTHLNQGWLRDFNFVADKIDGWNWKLYAFGAAVLAFFFGTTGFGFYSFI